VLVKWTREEEFTWAYFRPAGVIDIASAVRADGTLTAWEFHNYNSGAAAMQTPYDVPNQLIVFHPTRSPLRQGSYRALAATAGGGGGGGAVAGARMAREASGDQVVDHSLNAARTEQGLYDAFVTDWERTRYYERG